MTEGERPTTAPPPSSRDLPRVLVAAVTAYKSRTLEDLAKSVTDDVRAVFSMVRSVIVKSELQYIRQLVSSVATSNEADAMIIVGGTGFGPFDNACEAIDGFVERRIEGFGEDYRRLLRDEFAGGAASLLARATAGGYSQCVVFAPPRRPSRNELDAPVAQTSSAVNASTSAISVVPHASATSRSRPRAFPPLGGTLVSASTNRSSTG